MIIKSYELDKIKFQKNNIILLYGSNNGYKKEITNNYLIKDIEGELIRLDEIEIINNKDNFIEELLNK